MPCIVRWPGRIPAGHVSNQLCSTMDLLPTFAHLAGAPLPSRPIDGGDIGPLLLNEPGAVSPWDEHGFGFYRMEQLQAVRSGPWKLYLPLAAKFITNGRKTAPSKAELYNVNEDVGEAHEAAAEHPEIVERLSAMAERIRAEVGDMDQSTPNQRPAGLVENPQPLSPGK